MADLSYAQLEGLWIQAGGPAAQAPTAAAIALAESSGDPQATNPTDNNGTQTSWGLWQISNGTHSSVSSRWNVPIVNARLAVAKWKAAGGFSPWGTYNSGAYKKYMRNGTTPDYSAGGGKSANIGSAGGGKSANIGGGSGGDPGCLASINTPSVGAFGISAGGGSICLARKSEGRAFLGGLLIAAGGAVMLAAFGVLVGRGLASSGAVAQAVTLATGRAARPRKRSSPPAAAGSGSDTSSNAGEQASAAA